MLISRFPPIVFFAVPKTGSVSIETAFAPHFDMVMSKNPSLKHMTVRTYDASLRHFVSRRVAKDPVKLAVVREPLDWILSWHRYRTRPEIDGKPASSRGVSADDFILSYMSEEPAPYARIGSQYEFLHNKVGDLGVDQLYRFDDLSPLVAYLNKRLRVDVSIDHLNASPKVTDVVSPDVAAAYRAYAAKDFALYESVT